LHAAYVSAQPSAIGRQLLARKLAGGVLSAAAWKLAEPGTVLLAGAGQQRI